MAVNVDIVYKTVLLILNQQQRGYITPDEFNKFGTQVQRTMFEGYASDLNQQYRLPQNDTEYGNRIKNVDQMLEPFQTIGPATFNIDRFTPPGIATIPAFTQTFIGDAIVSAFTVTTWTTAQSQNADIKVFLNGAEVAAGLYTWSSNSNILQMLAIPAVGDVILIQLFPNQFYRIGSVIYTNPYGVAKETEYIQRNELIKQELSPITKPTEMFPVYLYEQGGLFVYPTTIQTGITVSYIRTPLDVVWNYTTGGQGQYIYNANGSQDFELHISEQTEIILRILVYAGIVVEDPSVIQLAAGIVQAEDQNEKS
tara:strand:- start:1199 stop:2131 length:933 start_codon:yes stop_codon:yes gene_type:complete